jgi:hypothetical protein
VKKVDQQSPFDIQDKRAISIDMLNNRQWNPAKNKLKEYMKSAQADPERASESILRDFFFQIVSKTEGGVSELSHHLQDLRDEVHSLIELSKSDSLRVPETRTPPSGSAQNIPLASGGTIRADVIEAISKSLTRKSTKCGREAVVGLGSGQCLVILVYL